MIEIKGGVTAPLGFQAAGVACGLKKNGNKDIALVYSEETCVAVGAYTTNVVKGHSLQLTMERMKNGYANGVLINSGCANACVGSTGYRDAEEIANYCANQLDIDVDNMMIGSTGVIGVALPKDTLIAGVDSLLEQLSVDGGADAAQAIMTTHTHVSS